MKKPLLLTKDEIKKVESDHPDGITSREIVKIFQSRGIRFSEATFRKYVQMGLLERSRRIGQKGKHRGSRGLYPVGNVRRINDIKREIIGDTTLEQLRDVDYFIDAELLVMATQLTLLAQRKKERGDDIVAKRLANMAKKINEAVRSNLSASK